VFVVVCINSLLGYLHHESKTTTKNFCWHFHTLQFLPSVLISFNKNSVVSLTFIQTKFDSQLKSLYAYNSRLTVKWVEMSLTRAEIFSKHYRSGEWVFMIERIIDLHQINNEDLLTLLLFVGSKCPPQGKGVARVYNMSFCPYGHRVLLAGEAKNAE